MCLIGYCFLQRGVFRFACLALWGFLFSCFCLVSTSSAGILDDVRSRGYIRCGVNNIPGYASVQADGSWSGFQVDFCRALAAALLQDPMATEQVVLYTDQRFTALADDDIDVCVGNITWTLTRETTKGVAFTAVLDYDGQGFIAHKDSGLTRMADARGKDVRVCVEGPSTTEGNIRDYDLQHHLELSLLSFETSEASWTAFLGRQCEVLTSDRGPLFLNRARSESIVESTVILPDVISREPLTPAVRAEDPAWESLVRWVRHVLVIAEDKGVTSQNVEAMAQQATDPEVRRLLGVEPGMGELLGLDDFWARRIIEAVGNYGEMFSRNLGQESPFKMERGLNSLWRDGGLMYAPPLR